ncbi:MAG: sigma-70 family RNA polymerase sigma factor [Cyclobacteriaceae bacterium]
MKKVDWTYRTTDKELLPFGAGSSLVNPANVDEEAIWLSFLTGDEESLVYIYKTYIDKLYTYGGQFCRQAHLLEDFIQELFFELTDKRERLSNVKSIKGYLFASLKRKILRDMRRTKREELVDDGFLFSYEKQSHAIFNDLKEADFRLVFQKVNQLPISQREIIFLYFYEGMKYSEIAEVLDVKVETARKHMYRALKELRAEIGSQLKDFYLIPILFNLPVIS